jgi:hypothetical protein
MCARSVLIVLGLLVVCMCGARSQSDIPRNAGIKGVIMISPIRPGPVRKGSEFPNAAPLSNAKFSVTSDETVVTTFTTDTEGRFQVFLKPGHYSVVLAENRFPKPCGPFEIDVQASKMIEVQWRCDSGIR